MLNSKILVWQRRKRIRKVLSTAVALGAGCHLAFSLPDSFCLLKWKTQKTCFCAHLKGSHYFCILISVTAEVDVSALQVLWAGLSSFAVFASFGGHILMYQPTYILSGFQVFYLNRLFLLSFFLPGPFLSQNYLLMSACSAVDNIWGYLVTIIEKRSSHFLKIQHTKFH